MMNDFSIHSFVILGISLDMFIDLDAKSVEADKTHTNESKVSKPRLLAHKWAAVYRNLRPFLRPFQSSSEGRLDFYHRSLSKVVRKL